ncbi:methyl-accepting chemotaxis protein [Bdellovibrio sp. HCB-162]|uniref:HAMP domain-containing methyl-accepting chemotaxis protein n=1 Tax=Bdellovibrio sp. HCB-162 TaxID=3394234 RepID=UPI0039BD1D18
MENYGISSWFRGIKGRLLFAAFLPMIGFAVLGTVAYSGVGKVLNLLSVANEQVIPTFDVVGEMRQARNKYLYQVWSAMQYADNKTELAARVKAAREGFEEFKKAQETYDPVPRTPEEDKVYQEVKPTFSEFYAEMEQVLRMVESGEPAKIETAKTLLNGRMNELAVGIRKWNGAVKDIYAQMAKEGVVQAAETEKFVKNMVIMVTLFSGIAIFGVLLWIAARISSSVGSIADRLTTAGGQVATSVEQLNEAGNSLSQSSTEAAASLEETVAALEEMTSMVQMNSDNAKQAAALSSSSRDSAEQGEKEIQSLIKSMTEISQSSKKIEEIIHVIDDIAFQTNLLALNAAVEAARAGEQGKGFAVVAEAVRALAQRSASSAKDISSLIKESVSQIEEGSKIADESGTVLTNIVTSIKKVADLNNEIAAASAEQTTGIQQIGKAMNQLDQASQSNAASAEEIAATSGEISNLAVTAQNLTVELNSVILGTDKTAHSPSVSEKTESKKTPTKKSNVVKFQAKAKTPAHVPSKASEVIPFDDDGRAKVGTTDGF